MQDQFSQMKETLQKSEYTGEAANGLVTLVIDGEKTLKKIAIKPECVNPNDVEGLQDLIVAAFTNALEKLESSQSAATLMPW